MSHVRLLKRLGQPCRQVSKSANSPFLSEVATQLDEYFSGARHLFSLPLMAVGTDFQKDVWYALATIPYGDCCTYYLSDLLYISLIISIFVSCLKAF